jgi:hypothetical protein
MRAVTKVWEPGEEEGGGNGEGGTGAGGGGGEQSPCSHDTSSEWSLSRGREAIKVPG